MNYRQKNRGSTALIPIAILVAVIAAIVFMLSLGTSGNSKDDSDGPKLDSFSLEDGTAAKLDSPDSSTHSSGRRTKAQGTPAADTLSRGLIQGSVHNEGGAAIANATVALTERIDQALAFSLSPGEFADIPSFREKTNSDGIFSFKRLKANTDYDMWVRHPEYAPKEGVPVTTVAETQTLSPVILGKGYQISGVITDTAGNPLPAEIELQRQANRFAPRNLESVQQEDLELGRYVRMTAEQDGSFLADLLPQGLWTLSVRYEGYAAERVHPLVLMGDNRAMEKTVVLGTEHFLAGIVLDEEGGPIANAEIQVSRMRPKPMFSTEGLSNPDGTFKIGGLPEGLYGISVRATGFSASNLPRVKVDKMDLEITMHQLGAVAGRVTANDGSPVENFQIALLSVNRGTALYVPNGRPKNFRDNNGDFLFEGINPGSYRLLATADGYTPTYSTGFSVQRTLIPGIDIHMQKGGKLSGSVLNAVTGEPVAGAQIILHGKDWKEENSYGLFGGVGPDPNNIPGKKTATRKSGTFRFDNAYPGELQVEATHPSFLSSTVYVDCQNGGDLDVGVFRLSPGGVIAGSGSNGSGEPLAGGTAYLTLETQNGFGYFSKNVRLDAQGRFRFEGLKSGTYKISVASASNGALLFMSEAGASTKSVYVSPGETTRLELISNQ